MEYIWAIGTVIISSIVGFIVWLWQNRISQKKLCREFRQSAVSELKEIQFHMAMVILQCCIERDEMKNFNTELVTPIIQSYAEKYGDGRARQIEEILNSPSNEITRAFAKIQYESRFSTGLKQFIMSYLDSQMNNIGCLDSNQQGTYLRILMLVKQYNEENRRYWSFFERSLDTTLTDKTHDFLKKNIRDSLGTMRNLAEGIIGNSDQLVNELEGV